MDIEKYIKIKLDMLNNGFSHAQVRNDIFRHIFKECVPNLTIDAMIDRCMELYAEVVKRAMAEQSSVPQANELLPLVSNRIYAVKCTDGELSSLHHTNDKAEQKASEMNKKHGEFVGYYVDEIDIS
jgi:hypothetical protein